MAYYIKYYAEFKNDKGHYYRINVYQRDYLGPFMVMGDLCGCVLEVQGNMGDIISPIVKTQLRFSLVDSSDKTDTETTKFGDWQEFFTPDDTLYKVELATGYTYGSLTTQWSGYITPDSWREDLDYRGIITITARDNIGHLKDFQFNDNLSWAAPDENGLTNIGELFLAAMQVIDFPMSIEIERPGSLAYSPAVPVTEDGLLLTDHAWVNTALFDGMNWYDVLEQTMEAIGYTFRYVGNNKCVIACLRNLPKLGNNTDQTHNQDLEFYGGTLELDPAVKRIEEEQDYKQENEVGFEVFKGLEFAADTTYKCETTGNTRPGGGSISYPEHDATMNAVTDKGQTGWDVGSGLFNPAHRLISGEIIRSEGEEGWQNYAFIASNQVIRSGVTPPSATFRFKTRTSALKVKFKFTEYIVAKEFQYGTGNYYDVYNYSLNTIKYYVMYSDGTTTRYWDGSKWDQAATLLEAEFDSQHAFETDFIINLSECRDLTDGGVIAVMFYQVIYKCWDYGGHGCYARLKYAGAELAGTNALKSNKVTTINDDTYNVMLTRRPLFGALSKEMAFVNPENYLAGMFRYPSGGGYPMAFPFKVKFSDQQNTSLVPLPVLIHEQILCYYYGAMRVLSGSAGMKFKGLFNFNKICTYKSHNYLFQGGTLDCFTEIITNAYFREYKRYDTLWDGTPPSYDQEVKYND